MEWWLGYSGIGAAVGFFAGLLGIGGGAITVPLLVLLFERQGLPRDLLLRLAVGTSMAAILPALLGIVVAGVLTAPLGAAAAHRLPTRRLKQVYAVGLYLLATQMLMRLWG
jgi:uncharacterized membrane protein YfcA